MSGDFTDIDEDGLVDVLEVDENGDGVMHYTVTDTDLDGTLESLTVNLEAGPYAAA